MILFSMIRADCQNYYISLMYKITDLIKMSISNFSTKHFVYFEMP